MGDNSGPAAPFPTLFGKGTSWRPSGYCGLLTVDIVSFGDHSRSDHARQHVRRALYEIMRTSFEHCRISIKDFYYEDRGDGVLVAISPEIRTAVLVSSLIDWLHSGLRRHNDVSSESAQIRLRAGVHTGEVHTDDHGLVGSAVNHVFRLTDANALKNLLTDSAAVLGLIVSERVYEDVIRHAPDLVDPVDYEPVRVSVKETEAPAWVRLLGRLDTAPPPPSGWAVGRSITSFVGRQRELRELRTLVPRSRLVTLVGPGGAGKTRLAVQTREGLVADADQVCADGAHVLDLAAYGAGEDLSRVLLSALRLATRSSYGPPGRGPADEALVAELADRRVLLVLDNCEHLLDEVAAVADALLTRTDGVTLLATSREVLGVAGETAFAVGPLDLPAADGVDENDPQALLRYPAVRLFADRARSADPDFRLTTTNCAAVAWVCRSLDGLPLPIELAAALVRALTPAQIAERLADRFRLLANGSRTVARHRTLQAVVDWSHDLLDDPAREMFACLSVFRGGFPMSAAEELARRLGMCPATAASLVVRLVDKSLLQATPADDGGMRYRMLETLREYAADRLAELGDPREVGRLHAELYVELAERESPATRSAEQGDAIRALEREDDNLRAAFEFCCQTGDHELALRLVAALGWYLWMRGDRAFGWPGVSRALNIEPERQDPLLRAKALIWSCHLGSVGHRAVEPQARNHGWQAWAILQRLKLTSSPEYAYCLFANAFACYRENCHTEGNAMTNRGLRLADTLRDPWLLACTTVVAGIGHAMRGEFGAAEARLRESARHFRAAGDSWGGHRSLIWLSRTYESIGNVELAERTAESAVDLVRFLELGGAAVPLLGWIARLRFLRGDECGAASALAAVESDRWCRGTAEGLSWITDCHALLTESRADRQGDAGLLRRAAELYGQAAVELAAVGLPVYAVHSRCRQAILLARLGESTTEALRLAAQCARSQSDRRAEAIMLDTMALLTTEPASRAGRLARAEASWRRTGTRRSPVFEADIARIRPRSPVRETDVDAG